MTAEPWNWEYVIGSACGVVGVLVGVWVKSQAQEATKTEFSTQIIAALTNFKADLIEGLTLKFVLQREHDLIDRSTTQRIDQLKGQLDVHNDRLIILETALSNKRQKDGE